MKKTITAIFAHPDDEAFGPSGTIAHFSKTNDVYLLCATKGEAGQNHSEKNGTTIANLRAEELEKSARILGVKQVIFLGFADGTLSNNTYHSLAEKIRETLDELKPEIVITNEMRGVSGHIDHIVVSMVASFLFYKLDYIKKLYYYCLSEKQRALVKDYFIFFPPGYKDSEITYTEDVEDVWEEKKKAMYVHETQRADAEKIISRAEKLPKLENFIILTK